MLVLLQKGAQAVLQMQILKTAPLKNLSKAWAWSCVARRLSTFHFFPRQQGPVKSWRQQQLRSIQSGQWVALPACQASITWAQKAIMCNKLDRPSIAPGLIRKFLCSNIYMKRDSERLHPRRWCNFIAMIASGALLHHQTFPYAALQNYLQGYKWMCAYLS